MCNSAIYKTIFLCYAWIIPRKQGDIYFMAAMHKEKKTPADFNKAAYGSVIREARLKKGISQKELADLLGVHRNYVSNWELGIARPDLNIIPGLCGALGITAGQFFRIPGPAGLSDAEERVLKKYRRLAARDRRSIEGIMDVFIRQADDEFDKKCKAAFIKITRSGNTAAAGTFGWLNDEENESVYIRKTPETEMADIIITVSGDSMEPTFSDGDEVLVRLADSVSPGEIGIFLVNGEGFIKEYRREGLYSHNAEKYPLRTFCEDDDVRCVGRVTGLVTQDMYPTERELAVLCGD